MRILCADLGGTSIKAAIVDHGKIMDFKETPTEAKLGGPKVMENLIGLLKTYEDFDAVGISSAGQVDRAKGRIIYANENIPGYTGMEVQKMVEEAILKPCQMENDVNCAALGETHFGAGKDEKDLLCLTYGTGIGGAIIINRQVYTGHDGVAGEFGHILTHPGHRICACGKKGCYEAYASASKLVQGAKEADPSVTNGRDLFEKIELGDETLLKVLKDWAYEVALGLASLTHIFNPSLMVLGGVVLEQDLALQKIQEAFDGLIMDSFKGVKLKKAELGNQAGLLGAYSLYLD